MVSAHWQRQIPKVRPAITPFSPTLNTNSAAQLLKLFSKCAPTLCDGDSRRLHAQVPSRDEAGEEGPSRHGCDRPSSPASSGKGGPSQGDFSRPTIAMCVECLIVSVMLTTLLSTGKYASTRSSSVCGTQASAHPDAPHAYEGCGPDAVRYERVQALSRSRVSWVGAALEAG